MSASRAEPARPARRRLVPIIRLTVLLVCTAALLAWGYGWIQTAMVHVHETDARIAADMIAISSRVDGRLVQRPVDAGSRVGAGQVVARIDDREAAIRLRELEAERARLAAERDEIDARITMVQSRTRARMEAEKARLQAEQALLEAIGHELAYAQRELDRAVKLSGQGMVSAKALDAARTDRLAKHKEMVRARAAVATARARLGEVDAQREEIQVLERERATLERREAEVMVRVERQRIDVDDRVLASPIDGVVSRAFVDVGEYVEAGQRIALLHDPNSIYVETNIRETDIRRVELGQSARIEVDAYPDRRFDGRVVLIGEAATSQFALLPSPNPSGHFTKVTQRLPVRIAIEHDAGTLRPGMMVEVFIDVGRD